MSFYLVALSIFTLLCTPKAHAILRSFDPRYSGTSVVMQLPLYYDQKSGLRKATEPEKQPIRERIAQRSTRRVGRRR